MDRPCTLTSWRVLPGQVDAFLDTARQLAEVLRQLPGAPGNLTLIQSVEDPAVFHSIGWFHSEGELEAMRRDTAARQLLEHLVTLSAECRPSAHRVIYPYR